MKSVREKVAVITGGASGVGLSLGKRLAREGARIVLADIEERALESAVEEVLQLGGQAEFLVTDVTKRDQIAALADFSYRQYGRVDMLFNNAGVGGSNATNIWEDSEKLFRWTMDVNFFGPLHGIQEFLPRMIDQGGESLLATTASGAGLVFPPTSPAYSASKAAVVALMEVLYMQLEHTHPDIKTAILFPGPHVVDTRLVSSQRNLQDEYSEKAKADATGMENLTFKEVLVDVFKMEMEFTTPDEFAEEAYTSILRDDFYILPLTDETRHSVEERTRSMLSREKPVQLAF